MLAFLIIAFLTAANFYQHTTDTIEIYDDISETNDIILHTLAYVITCLGITVLLMISGILIVLGACFVFDVSSETIIFCIQWARNLRI